jgi:hypothetical protein
MQHRAATSQLIHANYWYAIADKPDVHRAATFPFAALPMLLLGSLRLMLLHRTTTSNALNSDYLTT